MTSEEAFEKWRLTEQDVMNAIDVFAKDFGPGLMKVAQENFERKQLEEENNVK